MFELAHELALSFTQPRNITYDRFLLFTCKQKQNEELESFHCRLKALGAKCRLGSAEEDLIKDIFIAFMTNTDIQRELLMETRTAQQVLQFALNRERGQESQKAKNSQLNRYSPHTFEQISNITPNTRNPSFVPRPRQPTRNTQTLRFTSIPNPLLTLRTTVLARTLTNLKTKPPNYRLNLSRVFGEEFLAEATLKDRNLQAIIRSVKSHNWEELKLVSKYYYNLRNDLSVARSGCLIYDGKLVIPYQLQNLVINAVHRTHPGQVGMIRLANLIWFPQIHRTIALRAENCKQCLDQGKNLKPMIPKSGQGAIPKLSEPNEELQLDFAGPILDMKNNNNEHYILAAVDRFSQYPSAVVHTNCDTQTAIEFLNQYCKFHGIPRSIRCDQAQAFKSRAFEIFCKEKIIKLIFSPTHDHRASGMVERLIQTLKRRLATMNIDPIWDNTTIAEKISEIIESIRLIPNRVTKNPPFQAHFGRPKNTGLSNLLTKPNTKNLSYNNIKSFYLDKRLLQNPSLTQAAIWDRDTNSEVNLDIQ